MKPLLVLSLLVTHLISYGQISIRQSFNDDEQKENPAQFTITLPKDKEASYLADVALKLKISGMASNRSERSIITEYHRNNLADEEVNNFQVGLKLMHVFKKPVAPENITDLLNPNYVQTYKTLKLNATLKYRYDKIEGAHGLAATALFNYFQQGAVRMRWSAWNRNNNFGFLIIPKFGVEIQENFSADSTRYKGFVGRTVAGTSISLGRTLPNTANAFVPLYRWLINIDAMARYDAVGEKHTDSRFHPLLKAGIDFYITNNPVKIILGPAFTFGDNPIEGFREFKFEPQQFWAFALKIQR